MGSINPIVVTDAALAARAEAIADGLVASVSNFGGQLCTKPGVVFVPAGAAGDAFAHGGRRAARRRRADRAAQRALARRAGAAVERLAAEPDVRALGGAPAFDGDGYRHQPAAYEAPAAAVAEGSALLEEHFGPVVLLLRYGEPRRAARRAAADRGAAHRLDPRPARGGRRAARAAGRPARRPRRPRRLRRLPDRRRGHPRHAPRRPVPRDVGARRTRRWA